LHAQIRESAVKKTGWVRNASVGKLQQPISAFLLRGTVPRDELTVQCMFSCTTVGQFAWNPCIWRHCDLGVSAMKTGEAEPPPNKWFMKLAILWDVAPSSLVRTDRRFSGAYCSVLRAMRSLIALILERENSSETSDYTAYPTRQPSSYSSH
jgi:hypothetical protein